MVKALAVAVLAGPLVLARRAPATTCLLVILAVLLTAATQIGGLVLWLCVPAFIQVTHRLGGRGPFLRTAACAGIYAFAYLGASLAAVPLAGVFGRAPLSCGLLGESAYGPRTILTCLLNRHYVNLPAQQALQKVSADFSRRYRGPGIAYLDAGFPFAGWFPMIPHVSHGSGRMIDLALFHIGGAATPSPIGYWGFVQPRPGDPQPCKGREGWLRWDMAWLQPLLPRRRLDDRRTAALLRALAENPDIARVLIEPHLRLRLGVDHPKLRFQGCRAARHDDHIHVEF